MQKALGVTATPVEFALCTYIAPLQPIFGVGNIVGGCKDLYNMPTLDNKLSRIFINTSIEFKEEHLQRKIQARWQVFRGFCQLGGMPGWVFYSAITSANWFCNWMTEVPMQAVKSDKELPPYDIVGQEVLDWAYKQLKADLTLQPTWISLESARAEFIFQPVNRKIALLNTLKERYFVVFKSAVEKHAKDPWASMEVLKAADNLMKVSYAISCLTLDDLPDFIRRLPLNMQRTAATALCAEDSYQQSTFFFCSRIYHLFRGGVTWGKRMVDGKEGLHYPMKSVSEEKARDFYQSNTLQNSWNELYRNFCNRVGKYVNLEELKKTDKRFVKWIKPDDCYEKFKAIPGGLPG